MLDTTEPETKDDTPYSRAERTGRRIHLYDFQDGGLTAGPRRIFLYLPAGYDESADRYPVMYFHDGGNVFSGRGARMNVDLAHDRLVDEGLIHPAIVVGIAIASLPGRVRDLAPTEDSGYRGPGTGIGGFGGGLESYCRFIAEHLKPFVDSRYRTKPEPASTGVAGYSLGGLAAFLMAYNHPETFGLAGCMSSSFWWADEFVLRQVAEDTRAKFPVRFWLDSGGNGGDYGAWVKTIRVYRRLAQRGWVPGDDLAAYFDYRANHRFESAAGRMREVLLFLLRKEPLHLRAYRLAGAVDPDAPSMDLNAGYRRIVAAEAWYDGDLRLSILEPDLSVADPRVVTVDAADPLLLHPAGPGETTIHSTYQRHTASLTVIGYDPDRPRTDLTCSETTAERLDAPDLPYVVRDDEQNVVARFGVCHDASFLHISVRVENDSIVAGDGKQPCEQDGIDLRFDAHAEPILRKDEGYNGAEEFLYIGLSPRAADATPCIYPGPDAWERVMPAGALASCVTTPGGGYTASVSIPVIYLDEQQGGGPWTVFRLNLCVSKWTAIGGDCKDTWWQPDWSDLGSPIGSGIFRRA